MALVESELGTATTELEDFNYLAKVFGLDEIQLCEMQAAGPKVSALVNALLEGCFDNKFESASGRSAAEPTGAAWWTTSISKSATKTWTVLASWMSSQAGSSYWSMKP